MKLPKICLTLFFCTFVSACGFHPRTPADFPVALHTVYFSSVNPYAWISVQTRTLLKSMNVVLVETRSKTRYELHISTDEFTDTRSDMVNTTLPTNISFSKQVTLELVNNCSHHTLLRKTFSSTQSLTLNANQLYTDNVGAPMRPTLNHEILALIYCWLISSDVREALAHDRKNTVAHCNP